MVIQCVDQKDFSIELLYWILNLRQIFWADSPFSSLDNIWFPWVLTTYLYSEKSCYYAEGRQEELFFCPKLGKTSIRPQMYSLHYCTSAAFILPDCIFLPKTFLFDKYHISQIESIAAEKLVMNGKIWKQQTTNESRPWMQMYPRWWWCSCTHSIVENYSWNSQGFQCFVMQKEGRPQSLH
mgnify:FL=1